MKLFELDNIKCLQSDEVNYRFDKNNGMMMTWGKTISEDPNYSPYGPFILDIEVTTKCKGPGGYLCPFCYKSNTTNGKNMSFDTFKKVLDKMPNVLTQIAFGADAQATSNPDLFDMMRYSRHKGVIPNITVADIDDDTALTLSKLCGAVAVSRYQIKSICYSSVKKLTELGMKQVNIHQMISQETLDQAYETLYDIKHDPILKGLNAIVFLSLKKKGRGEGFTPLTQDQFKQLVDEAFKLEISFGFDSCGANKFLQSVKERSNYKQLEQMAEPCESSCFSFYIDVDGKGYPCSFTEGCHGWDEGIDIVGCDDFINDVWNNDKIKKFRERIIKCGRSCFLYNV